MLPELAEDIEQLTRLAYPSAAEQMVVLAKNQFVDALPDEDTRLSTGDCHGTGILCHC